LSEERAFGLSGPQATTGRTVKEYWWYLDSTPTHSWMRRRYMYPQAEFPYDRLVEENRRRTKDQPEFELLDTGIFDDGRYWEITADYAKAAPEDLLVRISVRNARPDTATLHLLPTLWFRNTWSWEADTPRPQITLIDGALVADHADLGRRTLASSGDPTPLFCENETNVPRLFGDDAQATTPYPKNGINDHVTRGAATVNIGPFDRSKLPVDGVLEQSDGTAWMAMYCQDLLEMALALTATTPSTRTWRPSSSSTALRPHRLGAERQGAVPV
jgi:hypothetical protein